MKFIRNDIFVLLIMLALTQIVGCRMIENESEEGEKMGIAITHQDFIKTKGEDLYTNNGEGELVNLRGVNVGGYLFQEFWMTPTRPSEQIKAELDIYDYLIEQYGNQRAMELIDIYQDNYFSEADFDNLVEIGVNVVRLPFWYLNIVDQKGDIRFDWYERFDWFIEEAGARGIYVILDFHGLPGSQNGSDHSGVEGGEDKEGASKFFFGNEKEVSLNQELFYTIWEVIAQRYKENAIVAGYDLINEPYCTYRYDSSYSVEELHKNLWEIYDVAYSRIREIDKDHVIIMEATWDPVDLPNPSQYNWTNIMYQYHNYMYDDYNNEDGKQISSMEKKINSIVAANYNVPVLMGEFNFFNNLKAWEVGLQLFNDAGINWILWTYKVTSDYGNWGLYHHTGGDINIEKIDDEKLAIIWAKVGDSRANQNLIDVVSKSAKEEFKAY